MTFHRPDLSHGECHFDADPNRDWFTFVPTRLELPLFQRVNGLRVHLLFQAAHELHIPGRAVARNHAFELDTATQLPSQRVEGVSRRRGVDEAAGLQRCPLRRKRARWPVRVSEPKRRA
jgi:hypothetical protein